MICIENIENKTNMKESSCVYERNRKQMSGNIKLIA